MTALHPCLHCHRKADCPIKKTTLERLRGLGITNANLRCAIPCGDFPIGTTVDVKAFEFVDAASGPDGPDLRKRAVVRRGVVSRWNKNKATIVLNKDQEIEQFDKPPIGCLKVETDRLTRIDVPIADLCRCGLTGERCENRDLPSVRGGEWFCWEEALEREAAL